MPKFKSMIVYSRSLGPTAGALWYVLVHVYEFFIAIVAPYQSDFPHVGSTVPAIYAIILLRQYMKACKGNLVEGHQISNEASPDEHVTANDAVPVDNSTDADDVGPLDEDEVASKPVEGDMEPYIVDILSSKFPILLAIAGGSFTKNSRPANVLDTESRHDWDALLYHFYTVAGEVTSSNVMYVPICVFACIKLTHPGMFL